jgi:hypothetical protein
VTTLSQRQAAPRSAGPFVTAFGSRLPVRILSDKDVPALLEFWDYLSRRDRKLALVGQPALDRRGVEEMSGEMSSAAGPILAIMSGPAALIRGICQYGPASNATAEATLTIDESLDRHKVTGEMLFRLADHARAAGYDRFEVAAGDGSVLLDALLESGFPVEKSAGSGRYLVTITEPR